MINLVRAELHRMASRRFFFVLLLASVLGVFTWGAANFFTSSKSDDAARAEAQRTIDECQREQERFREFQEETGRAVEEFPCPTLEQQLPAFDKSFRFAGEVPPTTRGIAAFGIVLAFIVGASAVGAEWVTGAMATFLVWEPRRGHVLAAKAIAVFMAVAVAMFLLLALLALVHLPAAYARGTTDGMGGAFWNSLAGVWGRGAALAGIGSLFGTAAAMLFRNTAGPLAFGGVYFAILDPLLGAWDERRFGEWLMWHNVAQFLGFPVPVRERTDVSGFGGDAYSFAVRVLPPWRPALLLSLYTIGLLLVAYAVFRARDVT